MKFGNGSFTFGRKKKKKFPSLEALKTISFITGSALAMNKVLKEKILEQQRLLTKPQKSQSDDTAAIIAGFVGGLLAGGITALLLAPESGEKLRDRVSSFFVGEDGDFDLESEMEEARRSAEEKLGMNGNGNS